ncbi:SPASM domain-containing protein [candidate division WOR-3 bacterium]|nr:SPASM domain-containing protein [candidate division WOR-3 bacterium]
MDNLKDTHMFEVNGEYLLYHGSSVGIFQISRLANEILDLRQEYDLNTVEQRLKQKYPISEIKEALAGLKEAGIFEQDKNLKQFKKYGDPERVIQLIVSQDCNLRCDYCFADKGAYGRERTLMDETMAKASVDFLFSWLQQVERDVGEIAFFGGEPLMNMPVIEVVIAYAKEMSSRLGRTVKFGLTTNGTIINGDIVDLIKKNKIATMVSIDGSAQRHNLHRRFPSGKGSYHVVRRNSRKLIDAGIYPWARATFSQKNLEVDKIILHLATLGFTNVVCSVAQPSARHDGCSEKLDAPWTSAQVMRYKDSYKRYMSKIVQRYNGNELPINNLLLRFLKSIHFHTKQYLFCGAGQNLVAITPDGEIYPCARFAGVQKYRLGNISSGFRQFVPSKESIITRKSCSRCWARHLCGGGCPADNVFRRSTKTKEMYCSLVKFHIEQAIWLYNKLMQTNKEKFLQYLNQTKSRGDRLTRTKGGDNYDAHKKDK